MSAWRLGWLALNSKTREATELAHDWLQERAPEDIRPETVLRWKGATRLAPLGTHRSLLLLLFCWLAVIGPLDTLIGSFAAMVFGAVAAAGLTLICLLLFGGGLGWLRDKLIEPFRPYWTGLELLLGTLILATAAMTSNHPDMGLEPLFWILFALAVAVWTLNGNLGFLVRASPLEWVGWVQFWGLFAVAIFMASGAAHFLWPTGLAAMVLLLACHPDGPVRRFPDWAYLLRGGDVFSLPPRLMIASMAGLHLVHAMLCISLAPDQNWLQLALIATGILLVYADVLLLGLPIGDGEHAGKFFLFAIILLPGITQGLKEARPGYEKAFLDALCLAAPGACLAARAPARRLR